MVVDPKLRKKLDDIKSLQSVGKKFFWCGWVLWIVETTFYLILYGFHTKPINAGERLLDSVSGIIMLIGMICIGLSMYRLHQIILKEIYEDED
jgi:hypothetical protein